MSRRPRLDDVPTNFAGNPTSAFGAGQTSAAAAAYGPKGVLDFREGMMMPGGVGLNPMLAAANNPFLMASMQASTSNPFANAGYATTLNNALPNTFLAAANGAPAFAPPDVMAQNMLAAQALAQIHSQQQNNVDQATLALVQQQAALQQAAMQQAALNLPFGADAHTAALLATQSANNTVKASSSVSGAHSNPSQQPLTPQMTAAVAQAKAVAEILRSSEQSVRKQSKISANTSYDPPRTRSGKQLTSKLQSPISMRSGTGGSTTSASVREIADRRLRDNIRRCVESRH